MTQEDVLIFLKKCPMFSASDSTLLRKATEGEGSHIISLTAGESLPLHFSEMLGVVLSGKLQILSADKERPLVLRNIGAGQVFGAASLFLKSETPLSHLVAQSEATLFFLTRDAVKAWLRADAAFMDAYLQFLAERVQFLNAKIRSFTAGSAERRLALWLAEHREGTPFAAGSLTALASALDIGRASLYRALDKMEDSGLIARNGRKITVPDTEKLLKHYQT